MYRDQKKRGIGAISIFDEAKATLNRFLLTNSSSIVQMRWFRFQRNSNSYGCGFIV